MKHNSPRCPIAIVGAGIAGLSAAAYLEDLDVPYILLERFPKVGGRLSSREGDGWVADHGAQFFRRSDERLVDLVRRCGLEERRAVVQGGVHRLKADGTIVVPPGGGVDAERLCIDYGFSYFTTALARTMKRRLGTAVGAIRWDNADKTFWWEEGQVFWFEDEKGQPIRDEVTNKVLVASGVILATTATAALRIAGASKCLQGLTPALQSVRYTSCFTGIFRIAHYKTPFWALEGDPGAKLRWLAFEERKAPERVPYQYSLLTVQASHELSTRLMAMSDVDAMNALYAEACAVLPNLPEKPISQTYKRWNVSQLETPPLALPRDGRWPVQAQGPLALAGDYTRGPTAEDAAQSGLAAVDQVLSQLPNRKSFLGLELKG